MKPSPTFPIVEPPGSFAEINQQSRSSIATIEAKSSGTDTAGTVQLISVEVDPPDGFPDEPQVRVLDASGEEVNSGGTVAALADGENSTFTVEVSTTEEQSRISTKIRGTITLLSTSSASPGTTETFTYDFNVRIDPIIITENPDSEVLIGLSSSQSCSRWPCCTLQHLVGRPTRLRAHTTRHSRNRHNSRPDNPPRRRRRLILGSP